MVFVTLWAVVAAVLQALLSLLRRATLLGASLTVGTTCGGRDRFITEQKHEVKYSRSAHGNEKELTCEISDARVAVTVPHCGMGQKLAGRLPNNLRLAS